MSRQGGRGGLPPGYQGVSSVVGPFTGFGGTGVTGSGTLAGTGDARGPADSRATSESYPPLKDFHSFHYLRHTFRVLEHLASLNLDLRGKRVLELSAGIGDVTTHFLDRGCTVHATDLRQENLAVMRDRFEGEIRDGTLSLFRCDLEKPLASDLPRETYDVVFCFGVLYHLATPAEALDFLAPYCAGVFLLETCVSLGTHEAINLVAEESKYPSQAASGTGCRPTRPWVFNQLKRHFPHVAMPLTQPNWANFITDWTVPESATALTRAIFVASREPIDNPLLVGEVPMRQRAH
jgi:2-polyprenyl-3-methyl-5-hydroxy-6-metoxy-1,4-benzoquinol methylase